MDRDQSVWSDRSSPGMLDDGLVGPAPQIPPGTTDRELAPTNISEEPDDLHDAVLALAREWLEDGREEEATALIRLLDDY